VAGEDPFDALSMRILHIGKYFPPVPGGMERFLGDLVAAQRAASHDAAVLVHDDGRAGQADPDWVMRVPVWLRLFFAPISPRFPLWLARALRRFKPQVLHMHMPNLAPFWALMLPSARAIPWVVHWHSDVELSRRSLRLLYPFYQMLERALLERAEAIIATSPVYLGASRPLQEWRFKCHVVPLGVDAARFPPATATHAGDLWRGTGLRLLAVGRLTYYKGFDTLVRAAIGMQGVELVIAGEGSERGAIEAILEQASAPAHIRLAGEVSEETLHALLASCDVLCLPSRERTEAFGIVLMEAMHYGRPLLVSELPGSGVNWVARHGQNAIAVPRDDVAAWRAAIEALAASPARRQMLGHLGRQRYLREFGIGHVERGVRDVYATALIARGAEYVRTMPARPAVPARNRSRRGENRLLVVIPALNEADDIGAVITQVRSHDAIDVLVVDDGSTDATASIALLAGASVMRAPLWQGAWGAIQTGIRYAVRHRYGAVITMDADGQHEPAYLPQLMEAADRGANVVIAACPSRGSRMRQIAWSYFRLLTGFELDDLTSGFRYYDAKACRLLAGEEATLLDYQDIGVLLMLHHARLRIAEIPVAMNPRRHGASRVFSSWWTVARYMAETSLLCLARWNQPTAKQDADANAEA
jgi:glycosyltransferase involved in cell wall biosynthesis